MPSCWKAKSRCRAFLSWVWWMFFCGESFDLPPWKVKSCKHLHLKVSQIEKTWCFFFSPLDVFVKTPLVFFCFAALFGSFFPPSLRHPHRRRWAWGESRDFFGVEELQSWQCPTMGSGCAQHRADDPYGSFISWQLGFCFELQRLVIFSPEKVHAENTCKVLPQLFTPLLFILTPELEVFYALCFCRSCWTPSWHPSSYSSPRALVAPRPSHRALATSVVSRFGAFGLRWWQCLGLASQSERVSSILATQI